MGATADKVKSAAAWILVVGGLLVLSWGLICAIVKLSIGLLH